MFKRLNKRLRAFVTDSDGTVAVETVIMLPILFWAFLATYVYFDAYRQTSINNKAAYVVGDVLSRETDAIDDAYIDGLKSLFVFLAKPDSDTKLRVTVVMWDEEDNTFKRDWTAGRGIAGLSNAEVAALDSKLPVMPDNERVILVETWSTYSPLFEVGLDQSDIYNFIFTSPRFAPLLPWYEDIPEETS